MERLSGIRQKINAGFERIKESFRLELPPSKEELIAGFPHDPTCQDQGKFTEFKRYVTVDSGGGWALSIGFYATYLKCDSCNVVGQYYQASEYTKD